MSRKKALRNRIPLKFNLRAMRKHQKRICDMTFELSSKIVSEKGALSILLINLL